MEQNGILEVINVLEDVIAALDAMLPEDLMEQQSPTKSATSEVLGRWGNASAKNLVDHHLHDQRLKDLLEAREQAKVKCRLCYWPRCGVLCQKSGYGTQEAG